MKKLQLFILLLLFIVNNGFARMVYSASTDDVPALNFVVHIRGGEKVSYLLSEHPVVTINGEKLVLATRAGSAEYSINDVSKFTFEPIYYFVAWLNNGNRYAYALDEHPVVTYSNGELLLDTRYEQISYPATEVRKFTFSASDNTHEEPLPPSTGLNSIEHEQLKALQHGDMFFSGCKGGSSVCVYSIDGKHIHTTQVDENGNARIMLSSYPSGVYIIKTETITHKIIKR